MFRNGAASAVPSAVNLKTRDSEVRENRLRACGDQVSSYDGARPSKNPAAKRRYRIARHVSAGTSAKTTRVP
jgi:hypothetical protein